MGNLIRHFLREGVGVWRCVEPAVLELHTGSGEIRPGTRFIQGTLFMGIDLAALLEQQYEKEGAGRG